MDVQTQMKNHSGQEVHSMTHLCPKCGWPYPNHHPSAKHRRAHQRVCGTLEGYELAADSASHSNLPVDDHDREHSDGEHPSPTEADISSGSGTVNEKLADDLVTERDIIANEQPLPVSPLPAKDADVVFASVPSQEFASIEEGRIDAVSNVRDSETPDSVSYGNLHAENLKEDENFQTCVLPQDVTGIEHPETLIEGYKNYPLQKLHVAEDMSLPDAVLQKDDSPVSEDSSLSEMKVQKEVSGAPSSDYILPKDKFKPDDDLKKLKEDVPIIQDVVVCEETVTTNESSGSDDCKSEKLDAGAINQAVDLAVESSLSVSHEVEAPEDLNDTGENNSCESHEKHCTTAPEIPLQINEVQDILMTTSAEFAAEPMRLDGGSAHEAANVTKDVAFSEEKGELSMTDAKPAPEYTIKYQMDQEALLVQSSDTISTSKSSSTVETSQSRDPSTTRPKILIEDEDVDNFFKTKPLVVAAPECPVDLHSQTNSLEGNWGSISVLSNQSDPSIMTESELLTPSHEVTPIEAGETINEAEGKGSEKTDVLETPSFLTLVEPRVEANQANVALAQPEDKKNEIFPNQGAGVGKPHSALKNLLVEATQESMLKSSSVQKDEAAPVTTVDKVLAADDRKSGGSNKEWDSPARYPTDIKQEKSKVKRHWMPFMCCSSVN